MDYCIEDLFSQHGNIWAPWMPTRNKKTAREGVNGKDYDGLRYPRYPLAHWWTAPTACLGSVPGDRTRYKDCIKEIFKILLPTARVRRDLHRAPDYE